MDGFEAFFLLYGGGFILVLADVVSASGRVGVWRAVAFSVGIWLVPIVGLSAWFVYRRSRQISKTVGPDQAPYWT